MVERLLIAVCGRPDDDCGGERGEKCVVRFIGAGLAQAVSGARCVGIHVGVGGAEALVGGGKMTGAARRRFVSQYRVVEKETRSAVSAAGERERDVALL
jgi:hypothetical protein